MEQIVILRHYAEEDRNGDVFTSPLPPMTLADMVEVGNERHVVSLIMSKSPSWEGGRWDGWKWESRPSAEDLLRPFWDGVILTGGADFTRREFPDGRVLTQYTRGGSSLFLPHAGGVLIFYRADGNVCNVEMGGLDLSFRENGMPSTLEGDGVDLQFFGDWGSDPC